MYIAGDEVVVASTDFDLKQAETRKIIKCTECGVNQIRLSGRCLTEDKSN